MRTYEENKAYMAKYMHNKYAENIELSRQKSRENYYRNKHSCYNQRQRIDKLITKLCNEITLLMQHNEECNQEIDDIRNDLTEVVESLK